MIKNFHNEPDNTVTAFLARRKIAAIARRRVIMGPFIRESPRAPTFPCTRVNFCDGKNPLINVNWLKMMQEVTAVIERALPLALRTLNSIHVDQVTLV